MSSGEEVLLDANVLVYAVDETSPYHEASRWVRERGRAGELALVVTPQVLYEFYSVVTDPRRVTQPLSAEDAATEVEQYLADRRIRKIHPGPDIGRLVVTLLRRYPLTRQNVFDIVILATMLGNDVKKICTYDTVQFERFSEVVTVTPATV